MIPSLRLCALDACECVWECECEVRACVWDEGVGGGLLVRRFEVILVNGRVDVPLCAKPLDRAPDVRPRVPTLELRNDVICVDARL
jgi:hypothetical protein